MTCDCPGLLFKKKEGGDILRKEVGFSLFLNPQLNLTQYFINLY